MTGLSYFEPIAASGQLATLRGRARRSSGEWTSLFIARVVSATVLLTLAALSASVGLLWFHTIPFHAGPDEAAHFHVVRFILEHHRLPVFSPDEMWLYHTEVGVVESYAAFPPLAYLLGAGLQMVSGGGEFWGSRALSLISNIGTVLMTFLIGRRLFPSAPSIAGCAALVVAFLPQFTFVGAYFNSDALALFEMSVLTYLLLQLSGHPRPFVFFLTGAAIGLLLLTKYTFYAPGLVGLLAALVFVRFARAPLVSTLCLLGSLVLTSGWWFIRNVQLYGEPIPGQVIAAAKASEGGNSLFIPANHGVNLLTLSFSTDFWPITLKSFIAGLGFLTVFLDPWYYALCAAAGVLAAVGLAHRLLARPVSGRALAISAGGVALIAATTASSMAISVYGEWSAQGRYLFPALIPIVGFAVVGWHWLGAASPRLRHAPLLLTAGVVALNGVSLFRYAIPTYFGSEPRHVILEVDQPLADQELRSPITVSGWALAEAVTEWTPFTPEAVAEYRKPIGRVLVYLDGPPGSGTLLGSARYGLSRRDVGSYFGNVSALERVGFELTLLPGTVTRGNHSIHVCAVLDVTADRACQARAINVS